MIDDIKLRQLIAYILEIDIERVIESSSSNNIEEWTSFSHVQLVMAIESEFEVTLSPEDMMDMLSVKSIKMILNERLDNFQS